jgi:hypothetical protein
MVDVVLLKYGESPPESGDRIVIVSDARTCMMSTWRGGSLVPHREDWPLDRMIDHARKEAEASGIATIYVREIRGIKRT